MPFWRRSLLKLDKLKSQEERFPILSLLRTESYLLKTAPQCSTQTSTSKPKFCPFLFGVRLGLHSPLPNKGVPPLFKESRGKSVSLISVSQISQTCVFNHCFQRDAKFYPPTTFFSPKSTQGHSVLQNALNHLLSRGVVVSVPYKSGSKDFI